MRLTTTITTPRARAARRSRALRLSLATALALGGIGIGAPAMSADPIANLDSPVMIMAREQPVAKFLRDLLGQSGVPVWVDDAVRGPVNGDFDKPVGDVLEEVKRAFQLTYYYDGAVLHVYPASTLDRKIMYLSTDIARQVIDNADALALPDASNRLEPASMGLVATGTRRFLEQVQELADAVKSKAAASAAPETFRVFDLEYGWADDVSLVVGGQKVVIPGVVSLLIDLIGPDGVGASAEDAAAVSGVERTPLSPARPKLKGQGLQSIGAVEQAPGEVAAREEADAPVTTRSAEGGGRARIVADPLNNAVVIRDRADRMDSYERLIAKLDVEPLMVEIEATIIDMNTDRLRELGIDWRVQYGVRNNPVDSSGAPDGDGGIVSLVLGDRPRFISNIRALERQGAARIVSKPHVITLANVEAVLDSTSTFFVRVEGDEEVDLFDVSVGTTMRVTPHVLDGSGGSQVKLLVGIEDGTTSDERVDRIPVIDRSTINTQALVGEGQSLLIGGLIRESEQNEVSKVPVLGDIPGVGALFRSNAKSARRTERLFLITPRITLQADRGEHRLDAPIVYGAEGDIVRSAPLRLQDVQTALAERDATFPVVPPLPASSVEAELGDGSGQPPRRHAPVTLQEDPAPAAPSGPAERPDPEAVPPAGSDEEPLLSTSGDTGQGAPLEEDGWQAVPGSLPRER